MINTSMGLRRPSLPTTNMSGEGTDSWQLAGGSMYSMTGNINDFYEIKMYKWNHWKPAYQTVNGDVHYMKGSGQIPVRMFKPDGGITRLWVKMYYDPSIGPTRLLAPRSLMHMGIRQDLVKGVLVKMETSKAIGKVKYVNGLAYVDGPAPEQWNQGPVNSPRDDDTASSTFDDHLGRL